MNLYYGTTDQLLNADPWVVSSLLQKAIRRGEEEIAQQAAVTLLTQKGSAVWRRLMVIAFEDVGAGSATVISDAVRVKAAGWRKSNGTNERLVAEIAGALARAPKDRSADYLICGAKEHPSLAVIRNQCLFTPLSGRLRAIGDVSAPLNHRALIAWYTSGIGRGAEIDKAAQDMPGLMALYRQLGAPSELGCSDDLTKGDSQALANQIQR